MGNQAPRGARGQPAEHRRQRAWRGAAPPIQPEDDRNEQEADHEPRRVDNDEVHEREALKREHDRNRAEQHDRDPPRAHSGAIICMRHEESTVQIVRNGRRRRQQNRTTGPREGDDRGEEHEQADAEWQHARAEHGGSEIGIGQVRHDHPHRQAEHQYADADDCLEEERPSDGQLRGTLALHRVDRGDLVRRRGQPQSDGA